MILAWIVIFVGCAARQPGHEPSPSPPAAAQRCYTAEIIDAPDWGEADRGQTDATITPSAWINAAGPDTQITARFGGFGRKAAKTSLAELHIEPERSIDQLVTTLVADRTMLARDPPITNSPNSDRVQEENRSVKMRVWIYAIKYEEDQDWHLIVGTDPDGVAKTFFSCEVSGLPSHSEDSYAVLLKVRQSLAHILGNDLPGPGVYTKSTTPIPVEIEGMLFFDLDHPSGTVGPTGMHPETAWEIHPVTKIELGPPR